MRLPFRFSRGKLIGLCLLLVWFVFSTVDLVHWWLADSQAADRGDDSAAKLAVQILLPLFWGVQIIVNARHLRRAAFPEGGANRDGKHCPHCGSDIGVLAVAVSGSKIRCPYCRCQLDYQGTRGVNLVLGGALLSLAGLYVWLTWPTPFWRGPGGDGLLLLFLLGTGGAAFSAALYMRAKRVLVVSSPPAEETAAS
jgi:hypothetical protein